jgi:hypothetical protein
MAKIDKSPKHGTTNETPESQSQADGTAASAPRGETQAQPAGPHGGNPATAGKQDAQLSSETPENREGRLNPSAPTQGTEIDHAATKGAPLNDTFGEAGDPHGRGNLEVPDTVVDSGPQPTATKPGTEGAGNLKRKRDEEAA